MVERPLCVLLSALGGQGGGLLCDWLVEAAHAAGYPAQATSIPGVAQRTGATTYYFELYPQRDPGKDPVFCLFPSAGDVDLVAALEPTEAARAWERGWVTGNTVVISSTKRAYSTAEKMIAGDGTIDPEPILQTLQNASRTLIWLDSETTKYALNAMVLGAIATSDVLPLAMDDYRQAIKTKGIAVETNLSAFEFGLCNPNDMQTYTSNNSDDYFQPTPDLFRVKVAELPNAVQGVIGHGLARLLDYQDRNYASEYLQRMSKQIETERQSVGDKENFRLSVLVSKRLAAWMSYEDVIRVAQLKTRKSRVGSIRQELNAHEKEPVEIIEFLKPRREEIKAILPSPLAKLLGETKPIIAKGKGLRLRSSSPLGYMALKLLAALRPLRPQSTGYIREQKIIETWLQCIHSAIPVDYALACQVAEVSVWKRGYGDVRERGIKQLERLFLNWDQRLRESPSKVIKQVNQSLRSARENPDCGILSSDKDETNSATTLKINNTQAAA